jgi:hypothetical protein
MAEWLKAHAWKACVRETVPWVRIPLSPPACLRLWILRVNAGANRPQYSSDFSFELRTSGRQHAAIFLRKAGFSPKLWTPSIRYGSRNANVSNYLCASPERGLWCPFDWRECPISNSPYGGSNPPAPARQCGWIGIEERQGHKSPPVAGFCSSADGLYAPKFADHCPKIRKVSGSFLKYSRFPETAAGD